jgi:hypothetical protein
MLSNLLRDFLILCFEVSDMRDPYILPVSNRLNQVFRAKLIIDGAARDVSLTLVYREVCDYWTLDIAEPEGRSILMGLPLTRSEAAVPSLLEQFEYLGLGTLSLIDTSGGTDDYPTSAGLGSDFVMVWGSA